MRFCTNEPLSKAIVFIAISTLLNPVQGFMNFKNYAGSCSKYGYHKHIIHPTSSQIYKKNRAWLFPDPVLFPQFKEALLINSSIFVALKFLKQSSLTSEGLIHSFFLGLGLWTYLGFNGWVLCVIYLIFGSLVTKIKMKEKEARGIAEARGGARGPENVWGSAATAMSVAMLTPLLPSMTPMLLVGYVASIATKLSDTVASEIGKAFGKTTYLITTLKIVPRGTEGAVSIEGTLAGIVASAVIGLIAYFLGLINMSGVGISIFAAFVATTAESYIGATFQDSIPWLTNELVNLINTIIGAVVAIGLSSIL